MSAFAGRLIGLIGWAGLLLIATAAAPGEAVVLDDFASPDAWTVITSDGVQAAVRHADDADTGALRLDFDFTRGSGYCVLHHAVAVELPKNYRFRLRLRGEAPVNNLEFKRVDRSGENVWWVNRRGFEFPREWRTLSYPARQFQFAWGPSGGKPLDALGAIEIAVTANTGGKGSVWLDQLTFEALPEVQVTQAMQVQLSSGPGGCIPFCQTVDQTGLLDWHSFVTDLYPALGIELPGLREIGGLAITWDEDDYAVAYDVSVCEDVQQWRRVASIEDGQGGRDYLPLQDVAGSRLRIDVRRTSRAHGVRVRRLRLMEPEFGEAPNRMFATIAREAPRGWYPRYFLGEQQYWTVVGAAHDHRKALLDTAGALEVDTRSFRLEPFVQVGGQLYTWADVATEQALVDGYLPIPMMTWTAPQWNLEIVALADGPAGASTAFVQYRLQNKGADRLAGALVVGIRPFQVLPPWHELNVTGGVARVSSIRRAGADVVVNEDEVLRPWTPPDGWGAVRFDQKEVVEHLAADRWPRSEAVTDSLGLASGLMRWKFDLAPGEHCSVVLEVPSDARATIGPVVGRDEDDFAAIRGRVLSTWKSELERVGLVLPSQAARLTNTFKTAQAHILINADGAALQPGPRTYARSWIRDGASASTALLYTGHFEPVRRFLDWYSDYQYDNGKIPCVVDRRGPDPVPEHDSTGEYIYAVREYYEYTHDRAFLERHWPHVVSGVGYIDQLIKQRLTTEYRDGSIEKRACYGLVPESISHEGYSAKAMHSYWDDFWVARGLADAARIAEIVERPDAANEFERLRNEFRTNLKNSIELALEYKHIDYIPGCVELGDFDATSTAIALFPCEQSAVVPDAALRHTFARYYEFFCSRRDGTLEWENYTPYELRLAGLFLYLNEPEHAHELLEFFLRDQRPQGWNQWAEVVWRDPLAPRFLGDVPHTWVAAEFLNAFRSLLVYESEADQALVLAAGVRSEWLDGGEGVSIRGWPTPYGALSYELRGDGTQVTLAFELVGSLPPGGASFRVPGSRAIQSVRLGTAPLDTFTGRDVALKASRGVVTVTLAP